MNQNAIEGYLSGELDDRDSADLEQALRESDELRVTLREQAAFDHAIAVLTDVDVTKHRFEGSVMAAIRAKGSDGVKRSVLTAILDQRERVNVVRWPDLLKAAAVACLFAAGLIYLANEYRPNGGEMATTQAEKPSLARVQSVSEDAVWSGGSEWVSSGLLNLISGRLGFETNLGAYVEIEGPAKLRLESEGRVFLQEGSLIAKVPPMASGFTVNTPAMNVVDIGTMFAVEVAENGDSSLHVIEGVVEASSASGVGTGRILTGGMSVRASDLRESDLTDISYGGDGYAFRLDHPVAHTPAVDLSFDDDHGSGVVRNQALSPELEEVSIVGDAGIDRSPKLSRGVRGSGLSFQEDRSLDIPTSLSKDAEGLTLSFWIRLDASALSESQWQVAWIDTGDESDLRLAIGGSDQASVAGSIMLQAGESSLSGGKDIADGKWHHLVLRVARNPATRSLESAHVFINGSPERLERAGSLSLSNDTQALLPMVRFGADAGTGFRGEIDEVKIFDSAIPSFQVFDIFDSISQ